MPSLESASQRAARSWHMGDPLKKSNLQSWAQTRFPVWAYIKIFTRGTFLSTAEGGKGGGLDAILFFC